MYTVPDTSSSRMHYATTVCAVHSQYYHMYSPIQMAKRRNVHTCRQIVDGKPIALAHLIPYIYLCSLAAAPIERDKVYGTMFMCRNYTGLKNGSGIKNGNRNVEWYKIVARTRAWNIVCVHVCEVAETAISTVYPMAQPPSLPVRIKMDKKVDGGKKLVC